MNNLGVFIKRKINNNLQTIVFFFILPNKLKHYIQFFTIDMYEKNAGEKDELFTLILKFHKQFSNFQHLTF